MKLFFSVFSTVDCFHAHVVISGVQLWLGVVYVSVLKIVVVALPIMYASLLTGLLRALSEPDSPSKAILSALPPYHGSLERSFLTSNYREICEYNTFCFWNSSCRVVICSTDMCTRCIYAVTSTHTYTDNRRANVLQLQHELLSAVHRTVTLYAGRLNPKLSDSELEEMIADYMLKLQGEAFKQIVSTVPATAEYLWTSGKKHGAVHGMEFCSVLNAIIRADLPDELEVTDVACIQRSFQIPKLLIC